MAKKEVRVYFNLDNENENKLYELISARTSAGGYLKDIALDVMEGRLGLSNNPASSEIVAELRNINNTLANIKILTNSKENEEMATEKEDENIITNIEIENLDIDNLDFDDIDF